MFPFLDPGLKGLGSYILYVEKNTLHFAHPRNGRKN